MTTAIQLYNPNVKVSFPTISDKVDVAQKRIDRKILNHIEDGLDILEIIIELRTSYVKYLTNLMEFNNKPLDYRGKLMYTYNEICMIYIKKLKWAILMAKSYTEVSKYDTSMLYNMVKLKDKLKDEKIEVIIPNIYKV